jgi:hypothetical protein
MLAGPVLAFPLPPDSLSSHIFGGISWDYCRSVKRTSDGSYILAGSTLFLGAGGWDGGM